MSIPDLDRALCLALDDRCAEVAWQEFSAAGWQALVYRARAEGVAPLLYHRLQAHFTADGWPLAAAPAAAELRSRYYENAAHNTLFFSELERVLRALVGERVPVTLLKGAALAVTLYGDASLRLMNDLDLLVPRSRLEQAIGTVQALGYSLEADWLKPELFPGLRDLTFVEANLDRQGTAPGSAVHVEIHWSLLAGEGSRFGPRIEWFWQHTRPSEMGGPAVSALDPTANVLYLAAHMVVKHVLFKHGEGRARLGWYYDLHLLLRRFGGEVDWDELVRRAVEFHWAYGVYLALAELVERFGSRVPPEVLARLRASGEPDAKHLHGLRVSPTRSRWRQTLDDFLALTPRTRLRIAWGLLFPSRDYMLWRYHPHWPRLWRLWYLYRWADAAGDVAKSVIRP